MFGFLAPVLNQLPKVYFIGSSKEFKNSLSCNAVENLFSLCRFSLFREFRLIWSLFFSVLFFEQPYIELANNYGAGKISDLETYVQTNITKFESVSFPKPSSSSSFSFWDLFIALCVLVCIILQLNISVQDYNLGLVKQVVASMYKRNIQRLTQTYLTLSLQDIANTVQLNSAKEAEMHVLQML